MTTVFQSAFLQALGYSIANSLWQMAILWLLYALITAVLKPAASRKYTLAVVLQSIGFIWFIVTLNFYYGQYSQLLAVQSAPTNGQIQTLIPQGEGIRSMIISWMIRGEQLLPYLSVAYLILMIVLCIKWIMGYRYTQMIRQEGLVKIPVDWKLFVKNTAQQLGITREVSIYLSEKIGSPLTIGFLKPLILVPVASINHLTVAQLEAVILHEMAHIKRYDYLVNILLSVAEISLFFNPFTQLLAKHIRKERENSCDDWVLQFQYSATTYAEALLRIAQLQTAPALAMQAAGTHQNELLTRVKRMIGNNDNGFNYRRQLLAFFLVTGILSSIAWLNPEHRSANEQKEQLQITKTDSIATIQPVAVEPMAVKVTNPLFNPAFFLSGTLKEEMESNLKKAAAEIKASFNSKEVKEAMQQVPNAINEAYKSINDGLIVDQVEWKKDLADMEKAQKDMQASLRSIDTIALPDYLRKPVREELELSIKNMEKDISDAKAELSKKLKIDLPSKVEQEKLGKELEKVLKEVENMDFENILTNTIQLKELFESLEKIDQKIKITTPVKPKEKTEKKLTRKEDIISKISADIPDFVLAQLQKTVDLIDLEVSLNKLSADILLKTKNQKERATKNLQLAKQEIVIGSSN